jgi:small subunit ribosomal protein S11
MARKTNTKGKQKEKKNIAIGVAHVHASFNNTIVTITDANGNTISWASAGNVNFKGSRKGTPFAAQVAADKASRLAQEHGLKQISIQIRGPGSGRETAMRAKRRRV